MSLFFHLSISISISISIFTLSLSFVGTIARFYTIFSFLGLLFLPVFSILLYLSVCSWLLYYVEPSLHKDRRKYENYTDHQAACEFKVEKILGKEIAGDSCHEKGKDKGYSKGKTVCQRFYAVSAQILPCSTIVVWLTVKFWWFSWWTTAH